MPKAPEKPRRGAKPKPRSATASKGKGKSKVAPKAKAKPAGAGKATALKTKGARKTATRTPTATKTKAPRPKREPIALSLSKGPQVRPTATATATKRPRATHFLPAMLSPGPGATGPGSRSTTVTKAVTKHLVHARGRAEQLGELPERYEDDSLVVLPVDPGTLFVWWDLAAGSIRQAAEGLANPRARLAIVEGKTVVRELDLALESRSFYVHGLPPGHRYHAEILWLDARGQRRRIGQPSAPIGLPTQGPSRRVDDRFVMFRFDGKLGPGVDPARLPPGPGGEVGGGTPGWGSSEHSDLAPRRGGKSGSDSP